MILGITITLIVLISLFYIVKMVFQYMDAKMVYDEAKAEKEEKERKIKEMGLQIIDQTNLSNSIKQVVKHYVKRKVRDFQSTYMDCDEVNIWMTSIFTFQLQCALEKAYIKGIGLTTKEDIDECKEFVRVIIKTCHLEAVKLRPDLKEY